MEPDQVEVAQQFAHDLGQLHQIAGRPSYSTLERVSNHHLKRATVSDVLNGNRVRVPDWRFVLAFVTACRVAAEENGLDPGQLGTVADWKRRWDAAIGASRIHGWGTNPAASARNVAGSPSIWGSVPPRMSDFLGRESLLDDLRQALVRENRTSAVAIQGLCGIGKTQLAVEYAYRYAAEYDLVWWIPCDNRDSAHAAMVALELRLGLGDIRRAPGESRYAAIFDTLRLARDHPRWLVIFDNANEPNEIRDLIPPRNGHILITSRNYQWDATEDMLELDVFTRDESIDFLRGRMRELSEADAHRLADAVGDLPLVLEHAVESRLPVEEYLSRLASDPSGLLASQPSSYPETIADSWRVTIDRLRYSADDSPIDLLRCLSFFGSEPIPLGLLEQGRYLPGISIHALLRDPIRRSRAISMLGRAGLLRVNAGTRTLQVHRLTQYFIRHEVTDDRRWRHDVHLLLAAADPDNPEDPAHWRRYEELRADIGQSDAEECRDESVRHLIVNFVRYLRASGDPRRALNLANRALDRWSTDGADASAEYLEMQHSKADALFSSGSYEAAFAVQQDVLSIMRADPENWSREILGLESMTGARLRLSGNFKEALEFDSESMERHAEEFGNDHPRTFAVAHSLAIDCALNGNPVDAIHVAEAAYDDGIAFYGRPNHPLVLFQQNSLARCIRLAGRYRVAREMQVEIHEGYAPMVERGVIDGEHPWLLTHEIDFAATRLDMGLDEAALDDMAAEIYQIRTRCWRALGVDHPQTLTATVTLGSVLRRITGRLNEAVSTVTEAERRYQSVLPGHPHTHACAAFLATIQRQMGLPVRAVSELESAISQLKAAIGENHPYTLAATVGLVNALTDAGEPETALARGREALNGFRDRLGPDHPHTLACAANVVAVLAALNREREADELRDDTYDRYSNTVGMDHPDARLFAEGKRLDLDFWPPPL